MSNKIFQGALLEMKDATNRIIGVIDGDGNVVACNSPSLLNEKREDAVAKLNTLVESVVCSEGCTYKSIACWRSSFEYAAFAEGEDGLARSLCVMASIALASAKAAYDEKHDRATFIRNIILDNILPGDIFIRSKELHFDDSTQRVVLLIRQMEKAGPPAFDMLQSLFPDREHDFVINVNDSDIALVKEIKNGVKPKDVQKLAGAIMETLQSELLIKTVIGIGGVAVGLKELAGSYKEAQTAIAVGKVFETEKAIVNYESLGIGRLIYQLPTTLCEMFLSEVFKKNSIEALDSETLFTIQRFFENNLNVSETSRKLFVHRNTLVYRLEKIKKLTGLDLREFDHAIVFKVALMVQKYLVSRQGR